MEERAAFGRWLKIRRIANHLTQRELGVQINYSAETIKKVEAGRLRPSEEFVQRVLLIFDIAPDSAAGRELLTDARSEGQKGTNWAPQAALETSTDYTGKPTAPSEVAILDQLGHSQSSSGMLARLASFFGQVEPSWWTHPTDQRYQRARKHMLEKVYTFWIKGVLENSLHGAALIELGLELRPQEIVFPWDMVLQQPDQADRLLPPQMTIHQVFREMSGALLILGLPGSGKTTTLLTLARELLLSAMRDSMMPIPVIFNLSSWATKYQPIDRWLIEELSNKYQVPKSIGRAWVKGGEIAPLLDGLDEMSVTHRESCVVEINRFRHEHGLEHMVICSRLGDYTALTTKLSLHGAVVLRPLTAEHINQYLATIGDEVQPLRQALERDSALRELAYSPLMLSVMTLAYRDKIILTLPKHSLDEQRVGVFATYIEHMFHRRHEKDPYPPQQTIEWLSWLAQMMLQHGHTIFLVERMQPSWLPTIRHRWLYTCGESISVGLIAGIGTSVVYGLRSMLRGAPHGGLADHMLVHPQFTQNISGLSIGQREETILWLISLPLVGVFTSIIVGLVTSVIAWLMYSQPVLRILPERGSWHTVRNIIHIFVTVGLVSGTIAWFFVGLQGGLMEGITTGVIAAVAGELLARPGTIASVESLGWSWTKAFHGLFVAAPIVLTVILFATLTRAFETAIWYRLDARILVYGLFLWIIGGITSTELAIKIQVNQGLRKSAYNALITGAVTLLIIGGLGELSRLFMPSTAQEGSMPISLHLASAIEFGLAGAIIAGLGYGGFFYLQQGILRLLLYASKCLPWNYTQFLDYNVERVFLHKVGGGYVFIHRLLLEYFAQMR
jgi:eukaryotic-like serine/threonine-protein kinase